MTHDVRPTSAQQLAELRADEKHALERALREYEPHVCPRCGVVHRPPDPEYYEKQIDRAAAQVAADVDEMISKRSLLP